MAPAGWEDPEGLWVDIPLSYDGSTASYAADQSNRAGDGPWLVLRFATPVRTDRTLVVADFGFGIVDAVSLEAQVDGLWQPLYTGAIANDADAIVTFPAITTDAIRFRFHYLVNGYYFWLYNFAAFALPPTIVAPEVATTPATSVTATSAALHGTVTSDGGEPCAVRFLYRPAGTTDYTATAWVGSIVSGQGSSSVLLPVTGLQSDVAYAYHIEAQNQIGVAVGADVAFTPQPVPLGSVEWLSASDVMPETLGTMTWDAPVQALDDDPATAARCYHPLWTEQWGPYLNLSLPEVEIDHVRLSAGANPYIDAVQIEIEQAAGGWQSVYQGAFTDRTWQIYPLAARGVYPRARVRFHVTTTAVGTNWELFEFQVRMPVLVSFASGAEIVASQPGRVDLPLRFQPATSSVPLTLHLAAGGTALAGVDWQFVDLTGITPELVVLTGASAPTISVDTLSSASIETVLATCTITDAQYGRIVAPSSVGISIVRGPPPPTFTERRSPLYHLPVERFDATRWSTDTVYRVAYLAARVPERVWETNPDGGALRLLSSQRLRAQVGDSVVIEIQGSPNSPATAVCQSPSLSIAGHMTQTFSGDETGLMRCIIAVHALGVGRVLVGSPLAKTVVCIQIQGVAQ